MNAQTAERTKKRETLLSELRTCDTESERDRIAISLIDTYEAPVEWMSRTGAMRHSGDEDKREDLKQELRMSVWETVKNIASGDIQTSEGAHPDAYIFRRMLTRKTRWEEKEFRHENNTSDIAYDHTGIEDIGFCDIETSDMLAKMREIAGESQFSIMTEIANIDKAEHGRSWKDVARDHGEDSPGSARMRAKRAAKRVRAEMAEKFPDLLPV